MDIFRGGAYAAHYRPYLQCMRKLKSPDKYVPCHKQLSLTCHGVDVYCANRIHDLSTCMSNQTCTGTQMTNPFLDEYQCLQKILTDELCVCNDYLKLWCANAHLRTTKTIRMSMEHVQHMMEVDPSIKVIHLIRDPRAVLHSQMKINRNVARRLRIMASRLCSRLVKDVSIRETLEQKYPGQLMQIRYEDLATNPIKSAETMYQHISLTLPKQVTSWIEQSTHAYKDNGVMGTNRENSTKVAYDWQYTLTEEQKQTVLNIPKCVQFLNKSKYDI